MDVVSAMPSAGGMSPADIKALVGNGSNGFLGDGSGNGILALLILFGLFGQGGFGNNASDTQNTILRAIDGSDADVRLLGTQLNQDVTVIQQALCDVKNGITANTGAVISSSKDVINAIQNGNCTLSKELAACCCENRLAICQQTNTLENAITQNRFDSQMGFTKIGNDLCTGFANQAFQTQQQTNAIQETVRSEGRATRDLIRDREFASLEKENNALRLAASQNAQTLAIEQKIQDVCGACSSGS